MFTALHSDLPHYLDYPTGRILRDARLYCVGAGTQEIRRMLIGREFNMDFGAA
jgi:isovaleryl-CoA dehydrogenase